MHINQVGQQFTYYLCVDARVAGRSKRTAWPSLGGIRIVHRATGIAGLHREMVCGPRSSASVITVISPSSGKNAHRDPSSEHRTQNAEYGLRCHLEASEYAAVSRSSSTTYSGSTTV
ncbi:hypothetical protein ACFQJ8_11215 [Halocatena marina]|uniref:hypothetical protein n=1 Tax=Halocatena marina TaxID=2934937 RepID=UPI00360805FE